MKIMLTGGSVQSTESCGTTIRRAVKTTLKNLKRWCAGLRHETAARNLKNKQQNRPREIKNPYDKNTIVTMIVDHEESRNRANENLENELKESLANNQFKMITTDVNPAISSSTEDDESIRNLPGMKIIVGDATTSR